MFKITIEQPKPYFAEIPYAVWGDVNYESIGDCEFPTDSKWTFLRIYNRETDQIILIEDVNNELIIQSTDNQIAVQTTHFLIERCDAKLLEGSLNQTEVGLWTYLKAQKKALIYALKFLTGLTFETAQEWTDWYHGSLGAEPGIKLYPIPDFEDWKREIEEKVYL